MVNESNHLLAFLKTVNNKTEKSLLSSVEISAGEKNVRDLKHDTENLIQTIEKAQAFIDSEENVVEAIVNLGLYLGHVVQELENIQELINIAAQRYDDYRPTLKIKK